MDKIDLSGNSLTAHAKQSSFSGSEKVNGSGLEGIAWVVHLLCKVERVVHS